MKRIVIAVLLSFLGPGLGQIYNRDYKKGIVLLIFSSSLFLFPLFWLIFNVVPTLPDPKKEVITQEIVQSAALNVIGKDRHILNLISFLFIAVWAYSITQAYFKAKEIIQQQSKPEEGLAK